MIDICYILSMKVIFDKNIAESVADRMTLLELDTLFQPGLVQPKLRFWLNLEHAADVLGTMANIYFVSVAAIVAAFFGAQAYSNSHSDDY